MATIDRDSNEELITSEAVHLLNHLATGLDEVIYEMARAIAVNQQMDVGPIKVEAVHAQKAGDIIISYLRGLIERGKLSADLTLVLDRIIQE